MPALSKDLVQRSTPQPTEPVKEEILIGEPTEETPDEKSTEETPDEKSTEETPDEKSTEETPDEEMDESLESDDDGFLSVDEDEVTNESGN